MSRAFEVSIVLLLAVGVAFLGLLVLNLSKPMFYSGTCTPQVVPNSVAVSCQFQSGSSDPVGHDAACQPLYTIPFGGHDYLVEKC